jgi:outer membrane cobalamin receptor
MRLRCFLAAVAAMLFQLLLGSFPTTFFVTHAQSTATINGTVTDPSDAAIASAAVTAEPISSTATPAHTVSDASGKFSLVLAPGSYRVSIEHSSFTTATEEFSVSAGETRTWEARMELEPLSSQVAVTASAEPQPIEASVVPVDVVTRQDIDERQEIFLTPIVASEPGGAAASLGPMGGITSLFLDGGNSNYTKVLVDGTPVNEPGGAVDWSAYTLDSIDKVEVVHGASSALYGSDAMDGVVQIFTHRGSTRTPEILLEGDGGTFGTGRGTGQISGLLGAFDYSAGIGYFDSNGQGPNNFFRDTTLSGNFGWKFSDTNSLRLTLRNNASDAGQPGQTLLFPPVIPQSGNLHDFSANLSWNFMTGRHSQHQLSGFESRFQDTDIEPPPPPNIFVTKYNRAGVREQSTYTLNNLSFTAGYEYEVENGPAQHWHNQGGYAQARYQIGRRLTAIAGGRVEADQAVGVNAVPRVGAAYLLRFGKGFWGATRLKASYGKGIKEPEMLPAGCSPTLDPERSTTINAGVDQFFASDRVHFSAYYFHNDFRDIVSFASGGVVENCPPFDGNFFNTDLARAYGGSSTFEIKATRWARIAGNYTYDDSRVLKAPNATDPALVPGNRLFQRPLHSANLIANAHFGRMNWNLAGYYVGRRTDSDFDGLGITSDPSYVRWDLANSITLAHGLSTEARVENLFDKKYQLAVGYPGLRLNYLLGLRYRWGGE